MIYTFMRMCVDLDGFNCHKWQPICAYRLKVKNYCEINLLCKLVSSTYMYV
nr:hypothetical protein [Oryctes rhinoceros nudivirus]